MAALVCKSCERVVTALECPFCREPALVQLLGPGSDDRPVEPWTLAALAHAAENIIRRLDEQIERAEHPSELHSILVIAKDNARRVARWLEAAQRRVEA